MGYNNVNQLLTQSGTGYLPVRLQGTVDEPADVTVEDLDAQVHSDLASGSGGQIFTTTVDRPAGNSTVAVEATDYNAAHAGGPHKRRERTYTQHRTSKAPAGGSRPTLRGRPRAPTRRRF